MYEIWIEFYLGDKTNERADKVKYGKWVNITSVLTIVESKQLNEIIHSL